MERIRLHPLYISRFICIDYQCSFQWNIRSGVFHIRRCCHVHYFLVGTDTRSISLRRLHQGIQWILRGVHPPVLCALVDCWNFIHDESRWTGIPSIEHLLILLAYTGILCSHAQCVVCRKGHTLHARAYFIKYDVGILVHPHGFIHDCFDFGFQPSSATWERLGSTGS